MENIKIEDIEFDNCLMKLAATKNIEHVMFPYTCVDNSACGDTVVLTLVKVVNGTIVSQKRYFGKFAEEKYKQMVEKETPSVLFMK